MNKKYIKPDFSVLTPLEDEYCAGDTSVIDGYMVQNGIDTLEDEY